MARQGVDADVGVGQLGRERVAQPVVECAEDAIGIDAAATKRTQHPALHARPLGFTRETTDDRCPFTLRLCPFNICLAESLALDLRRCGLTERDWRTTAERWTRFVTWFRHAPSDAAAPTVGPGSSVVRGPGRINSVLAVRGSDLHDECGQSPALIGLDP